MVLFMQSQAMGISRTRTVVSLAAGTLLQHMSQVDAARAFRDLEDFVIYMKMVRFEQVGLGVPMESPFEPGRVGHRKKDRALTIDVHYNEINMVHDRVQRNKPGGRDLAVSRDYLDTFAERMETAVAPLLAWCDRKKAWADRDYYLGFWEAALADLKGGKLRRPYEFTTTPKVRDALNACWTLVEAEPLESEQFEWLAEAYYLVREAGWHEADYDADPTAEPTHFGQPCLVSNFAANIAASPAPDATYGYSAV